MTLIYAIILFVLLIFPHELGHFLVAKGVGVKVNEFSFGMGPAAVQKQKGETLYCLGDIVHNTLEVERLANLGLITIDHVTSRAPWLIPQTLPEYYRRLMTLTLTSR